MKFTRLGAFTLGVVVTTVSVGAVSFANATGNGTLKACANKTTGVMRYISKGSCKKTETSLSWNQMGQQGLPGAAGTNGTAGAKGDTGAAGTNGDTGAAGPKGDTGAAGPKGDSGLANAPSPSGFTTQSVCGANGTSLCAAGIRGPGGGTVFYVDSANEIAGYDYLEVAPTDADVGDVSLANLYMWAGFSNRCGTDGTRGCGSNFMSDVGTAFERFDLGTGRAATVAIVARHEAGGVAQNLYAAGAANEYTTATASDWYLPSREELNELCKYAHNTGQAKGRSISCSGGILRDGFTSDFHWSSSEGAENTAWRQFFGCCFRDAGEQSLQNKLSYGGFVRPIRGF